MTDLAGVAGIGGTAGIAGAVLSYVLKAYIDKRSADREDAKVERESESGIVETTSVALKIVREQMVLLMSDMQELRNEVTSKTTRIKTLEERVSELEAENRQLKSGLR